MAGEVTELLPPCCISDVARVAVVGCVRGGCLAANRPNVKRKVSLVYINYKN